jgi:hypothetical protein
MERAVQMLLTVMNAGGALVYVGAAVLANRDDALPAGPLLHLPRGSPRFLSRPSSGLATSIRVSHGPRRRSIQRQRYQLSTRACYDAPTTHGHSKQ